MVTTATQSQPSQSPPPSDDSGLDTSGIDEALQALQSQSQGDEQSEQQTAKMLTAEQQRLTQDSSGLDQLADEGAKALSTPAPQPPQQKKQSVFNTVIPLLLMTAFGGRGAKSNAQVMLGGITGMVQGTNAANEQQFQQAHQQYQEAYQRWLDNQNQMEKVYEMYQDAYKGRIDADQKALDSMMASLKEQEGNRRMSLQDWANLQATKAQIIGQHDSQQKTDAYRKGIEQIQQKRLQLEQQKVAAAGGTQLTDRAQQLAGELALMGVGLPTGTRSAAARAQLLNGLANEHPDLSPQQLAQQIKGGQIQMRVQQTEATQVARREGNIESAVNALTEPGGLFDQLDAAARKIDFGSDKVANDLRLAAQGRAVSDPDIQRYVTLIQDVQTDVTSVLSRTGQATDAVRRQAMDAFPLQSSYAELKTEIDASRKVARALGKGNQAAINALVAGNSFSDTAAQLSDNGQSSKGSITAATLSEYAKLHKTTPDKARQFLESQGYTVQ